jgi:hypothetical protein
MTDIEWLNANNQPYNDGQLHDFIERVGILIFDGGLGEDKARVLAKIMVFVKNATN